MIFRAWLDGTHRKPIVTDRISNPTDISIDIITHDVYWVDINQDAIFKVDYKGEQRQMIRRNLPSPRGLAILHGDLFWVDRNLAQIAKASKLPAQVAQPTIVSCIQFIEFRTYLFGHRMKGVPFGHKWRISAPGILI